MVKGKDELTGLSGDDILRGATVTTSSRVVLVWISFGLPPGYV